MGCSESIDVVIIDAPTRLPPASFSSDEYAALNAVHVSITPAVVNTVAPPVPSHLLKSRRDRASTTTLVADLPTVHDPTTMHAPLLAARVDDAPLPPTWLTGASHVPADDNHAAGDVLIADLHVVAHVAPMIPPAAVSFRRRRSIRDARRRTSSVFMQSTSSFSQSGTSDVVWRGPDGTPRTRRSSVQSRNQSRSSTRTTVGIDVKAVESQLDNVLELITSSRRGSTTTAFTGF
jgi:hypothetical protein